MEEREGMEGGGVEWRVGTVPWKRPHTFPHTHTHTHIRWDDTKESSWGGKRIKETDNSLPSLLSETPDTHKHTHTQYKRQKVSRYKEVCVSKYLDSKKKDNKTDPWQNLRGMYSHLHIHHCCLKLMLTNTLLYWICNRYSQFKSKHFVISK